MLLGLAGSLLEHNGTFYLYGVKYQPCPGEEVPSLFSMLAHPCRNTVNLKPPPPLPLPLPLSLGCSSWAWGSQSAGNMLCRLWVLQQHIWRLDVNGLGKCDATAHPRGWPPRASPPGHPREGGHGDSSTNTHLPTPDPHPHSQMTWYKGAESVLPAMDSGPLNSSAVVYFSPFVVFNDATSTFVMWFQM